MDYKELNEVEELLGIEPTMHHFDAVYKKCVEGLNTDVLEIFLAWWNQEQAWTKKEWNDIYKKNREAYSAMMQAISWGCG